MEAEGHSTNYRIGGTKEAAESQKANASWICDVRTVNDVRSTRFDGKTTPNLANQFLMGSGRAGTQGGSASFPIASQTIESHTTGFGDPTSISIYGKRGRVATVHARGHSNGKRTGGSTRRNGDGEGGVAPGVDRHQRPVQCHYTVALRGSKPGSGDYHLAPNRSRRRRDAADHRRRGRSRINRHVVKCRCGKARVVVAAQGQANVDVLLHTNRLAAPNLRPVHPVQRRIARERAPAANQFHPGRNSRSAWTLLIRGAGPGARPVGQIVVRVAAVSRVDICRIRVQRLSNHYPR